MHCMTVYVVLTYLNRFHQIDFFSKKVHKGKMSGVADGSESLKLPLGWIEVSEKMINLH